MWLRFKIYFVFFLVFVQNLYSTFAMWRIKKDIDKLERKVNGLHSRLRKQA
jgi:hypothetical protein